MDKREELIKALGGAFITESEKEKEDHYKFEEVQFSNMRPNRLVDIKSDTERLQALSPEKTTINNLAKFLQSSNTTEGRTAYSKLKELTALAEKDEALFTKLYEVSKEITERVLSTTPESPQRALLVVHALNCLKGLEESKEK